jgi:ABC transporter substrate binding protein (PQQ-dependent alcohol dehydrogenase system)
MTEWRWPVAALLSVATFVATTAAQAATLTIGVLQRADDDRLDAKRVEQAYPHQPGGPLTQAAEVAVKESAFELDAAKLQVKLDVRSARSAEEAKAALQQLSKVGAAAVVLDIPAAWMSVAKSVAMPLINAGEADEGPRQQGCASNLFHTLPSDRMRADALAQTLLARKWSRVLLLQGPRAEDAAQLALVQAAIKRYGLKTVAVRPFKLSADPRERDLGNSLLLTGNADYDVVWVIDADYEFARSLPFKTSLPRPVVGDAGLLAEAWAPRFERFGAPQLSRRFARAATRPMTGPDWAAYIATKAVIQAAMEQAAGQATAPSSAQILKALTRPDFTLDGFKGVRLSFRPWDRQLRQPMLMTDGVGVIGTAPVEGVMHPKNVLDTLGVDAPESACKAR